MAEKYDAIVVGAGIAGLGVAGLLQRAGMNTLCIEKDDRAGGRMQGFDLEGAAGGSTSGSTWRSSATLPLRT